MLYAWALGTLRGSTHRLHCLCECMVSLFCVCGLDLLADVENVKKFLRKQKCLKTFTLTVASATQPTKV